MTDGKLDVWLLRSIERQLGRESSTVAFFANAAQLLQQAVPQERMGTGDTKEDLQKAKHEGRRAFYAVPSIARPVCTGGVAAGSNRDDGVA